VICTNDAQAAQVKDQAYKADSKLQAYASDASKKFDETRKDVGSNLNAAVDKFDKTVEKKAAETKGWLGGWFGGK
jgi:gas vesicle protein